MLDYLPTSAEGIAGLGVVVMFVLWLLDKLFGLFGWIAGLWRKPADVNVNVTAIPQGAAGILTLEAHEERLRAQAARITAEMQTAHGAELERLTAEKTEVESRLANSQASFEDAQRTIADLTARLDRMGNQIGGDRLADAKAALAREDFDEAREIFEEVEARAQIGVQNAADAAFGLGEIAEAEIRWPDAADHYARAARLTPTYATLTKAGRFLGRAGRSAEALRYHEDLVALSQRDHGDDAPETAAALNELALTCQALGRYAEAEPLFRQALQIGEATLGAEHPDYATHLNNLASLLRAMGRLEEAEPLFRQALQIGEATLGAEHPDYAIHLNNLALLLHAMGRLEEAEPLYRQALRIDEATLGAGHPAYATHLNNLAGLLHDMGRLAKAEPLYRQALRIGEATLGAGHPAHATHLNNLARLLHDMGRLEEAEPLFRQALRIDEATLGAEHPGYATHLNNLARLLQAMGRSGEAEPLFAGSLAILRTELGDDHPSTRKVAGNRARFLRQHVPDDPAIAEIEAAFGRDIGRQDPS